MKGRILIKKSPYASCNILVFSKEHAQMRLLLAQRKKGFGIGKFTIPGGQQKAGETLKECSERELSEETGLILLKGKPISLRVIKFCLNPWVLSVGVLAEEYSGSPVNKEKHNHTEWEWYDVHDLPEDLFGPTRIAIMDFFNNKFGDLRWEDIEAYY